MYRTSATAIRKSLKHWLSKLAYSTHTRATCTRISSNWVCLRQSFVLVLDLCCVVYFRTFCFFLLLSFCFAFSFLFIIIFFALISSCLNLYSRQAKRLTRGLPGALADGVCIFMCTGSEANDLAVRMAKTVTGMWAWIDWIWTEWE
jgi:hypothetical protein